jgi:hypothetical protein
MKNAKLLSILHYIWGGFWSFYTLAILSAFFFSTERMWNTLRASVCKQEPFIGNSCDQWIIVFSVGIFIMFVAMAITNILSAVNYWRSKAYTINWVAASLNLINFPFGTILGVFSLWVLKDYLNNLTNKKSE